MSMLIDESKGWAAWQIIGILLILSILYCMYLYNVNEGLTKELKENVDKLVYTDTSMTNTRKMIQAKLTSDINTWLKQEVDNNYDKIVKAVGSLREYEDKKTKAAVLSQGKNAAADEVDSIF